MHFYDCSSVVEHQSDVCHKIKASEEEKTFAWFMICEWQLICFWTSFDRRITISKLYCKVYNIEQLLCQLLVCQDTSFMLWLEGLCLFAVIRYYTEAADTSAKENVITFFITKNDCKILLVVFGENLALLGEYVTNMTLPVCNVFPVRLSPVTSVRKFCRRPPPWSTTLAPMWVVGG